jgi:hypothetical protein
LLVFLTLIIEVGDYDASLFGPLLVFLTLIIEVGDYDASLFGPFTRGMRW